METTQVPRLRRIPKDWNVWKFNAHSHSTESDGELTIKQIDEIAQEWGGIVAITDHNNTYAHENFVSPNIVPGIEIKVRPEDYGIDFLLYQEREKLLEFCEKIVYPKHNTNPKTIIAGTTQLTIYELLDAAVEHECSMVFPHYLIREGCSVLPKEEQIAIVKKYKPIIELNGMLSRYCNAKAQIFALLHKLPTIASGDSHLPGQYTATYTEIPLPPEHRPIGKNLFEAVYTYPRFCKKYLKNPTTADSLATAYHVVKKSGIGVVTDYIKRWFTHTLRPIAPEDPNVQQQLLERLQREDEDGEDDS